MANEPSIRLAERLIKLTPASLGKVFFGLTGSDGNDTLIKIIWYYNNLLGRPNKKKIIARKLAYHGVTIASGSLSGLPNLHGGFDLPVDRFLHVTTAHHYRHAPAGMSEREFSAHLAKELEEVILREGRTRSRPSSRNPSWGRVASTFRRKVTSKRSCRF